MDIGLSEEQFWNFTLGELKRYFDSYGRRKLEEARELASNNYILADLIGRSVSRIYTKEAEYPQIYDAYPTLFDGEEARREKQQKQIDISVLRFQQFAKSFNENHKGVANNNE